MNWYAGYLNLDIRPDRKAHMERELARVGIQAERIAGKLPSEYDLTAPKLQTIVARQKTPGAVGCYYGQVSIMERAYAKGQHALVMEDDLVFCDDFDKRLPIIEEFCNTHEWDVFWLGGCYHLNVNWHRRGHTEPAPIRGKCNCTLNRDWDVTDNPRIRRTYGAWSTHCYIVNKDSLEKVLTMLEDNLHSSIGIDFEFIMLAPQMNQYIFNPGCVKQYDNQSNIGNGMTHYSHSAHLGPHWFQKLM